LRPKKADFPAETKTKQTQDVLGNPASDLYKSKNGNSEILRDKKITNTTTTTTTAFLKISFL
jgi:hypothetical protein